MMGKKKLISLFVALCMAFVFAVPAYGSTNKAVKQEQAVSNALYLQSPVFIPEMYAPKIYTEMLKKQYGQNVIHPEFAFLLIPAVPAIVEGALFLTAAAALAANPPEVEEKKDDDSGKSKSNFPPGALSGKDVVDFLKKEGFKVVSQNGSHVKLKGPNGEVVIVPVHGNKSLPAGTLNSIKKQAGYK